MSLRSFGSSMAAMTIMVLVSPSISFAQDSSRPSYTAFGGGFGGSADAPSLSLEFGRSTTNRNHNHLFGLGATVIFNAGDVPSDTLEYPVPHGNYTSHGTEQKRHELGLFGKYGFEGIPDTRIFFMVIAGATFAEEVELAQSNVTGWYYEQSSDSQLHGMFGGGISWHPAATPIVLQVEYDNRRGITAGAGFRW